MNDSVPDTVRFTPRITVAAIVARLQRFLIIEEQVNGRLVLNQPAGHLEAGETLQQAVCRETLEESGCKIEPLRLISICHTDIDNPGKTKLRFNFAAKLLAENPVAELDTGIVAVHWLTVDELRAQQQRLRSPVVLSSIEDYQAGLCMPLSVVQSVHT